MTHQETRTIAEHVDAEVRRLDRSASAHHWAHRLGRAAVIVAGVLITASVGRLPEEVPFVLGIVVALTEAMLALFQVQENWFRYRVAAEGLRAEEWQHRFRVNDYWGLEDADADNLMARRMHGILGLEFKDWMKQTRPEQSDANPRSRR